VEEFHRWTKHDGPGLLQEVPNKVALALKIIFRHSLEYARYQMTGERLM
jgi:hypothetical protein